jgi:hypothetical protein
VLRLGLRRPNPAIAAWNIVFLDAREGTSSLNGWRASYEDFERAKGTSLPRRVGFAQTGRGLDDGVEISIKERIINPTFPPNAFLLAPPPGYAVEVAPCSEAIPAR